MGHALLARPSEGGHQDLPLGDPEMLRKRGLGDPDEAPEPVEGDLRGRFIVTEPECEDEEFSLAGREPRQGLPCIRGRRAHGSDPARAAISAENLPKPWEHGLRHEERHARLPTSRPSHPQRENPATGRELLPQRLGHLPLDPRDVLSALAIRGEHLEPHEAVPPDEGARLALNRVEVLERPAPVDPDDEDKDLRPHRERLEHVKGLVVLEEPLAEHSEILEQGDGHAQLDPLHQTWLTGKPSGPYSNALCFRTRLVLPMEQDGSKPFVAETSVITCDMTGIVQQYAADAEELFGWKREEVIGKMSVASFHVPDKVPTLVPRLLREAVENGKFEEEVTLVRKDGSHFPAILTVRPMYREGQQVGYMGRTLPLGPPVLP